MTRETEVLPKMRRARLVELIDKQAHGNAAEYARINNIGQSLLSRYVAVAGKASKPMGWVAARNMERCLGLEDGYLDSAEGVDWQVPEAAPVATHVAVARSSNVEAPVRALAKAVAHQSLTQSLADLAGRIPSDRREIVAGLVSAILTSSPPNPVFQMLLDEEMRKHGL